MTYQDSRSIRTIALGPDDQSETRRFDEARLCSLATDNSLPDTDFKYIATFLSSISANRDASTSAELHNVTPQTCKIAAWEQHQDSLEDMRV
jgi:hypothetical protein